MLMTHNLKFNKLLMTAAAADLLQNLIYIQSFLGSNLTLGLFCKLQQIDENLNFVGS